MDIKSKKGFVLAMAIMFTIIAMMLSIGLYTSVEHVVKETKLHEREYVKGHYAAIAGLRYAAILLRNPVSLFGDTDHDGEAYVVVGDEHDPNFGTGNPTTEDFFQDIGAGLIGNTPLTITITEYDPLNPEWTQDEYQVTAAWNPL